MNEYYSLWCSESCDHKMWALGILESLDNQCCRHPVAYEKVTAITTVFWQRLWKSEYKNKSEGLLFILCIEHLVKMAQK